MKVLLSVIMSVAFMSSYAFAEESAMNKAADSTKEAAQDTGKAIKKGARKVSDKTCEMVNGKMECAAKKVKHSVQNGMDEIKDKANDKK